MSTASRRSMDPRSIVTAEAFELAPELLGTPLARPARRLGAVLLDLVLIGLLSQAGGILLGIVATLFFIYLARGRKPADALARAFRLVVGCFGALVLLVTSCSLFFAFGPDWEELVSTLPDEIAVEAPSGPGGEIGLADILEGTQEFRRLHRAATEAEAEEAAASLARRLHRLGAPASEIPGALREMAPDDAAWSGRIDRIVATAMASLDSSRVTVSDTGPPTGARGDTAAPAAEVGEEGAGPAEPLPDTVAALLAALDEERRDRDRAERRLEEARQELERGGDGWLPGAVRRLWDDLGLAFGWGTIYMTIFLSWWNGQTPGKRILGIRVVQLDNSPIS
ncbi:MAG TPA: RDD family protein, partial [Longimicrobiales bacterium]|nr:RDD family protein [Longimicrobiales bacterium]